MTQVGRKTCPFVWFFSALEELMNLKALVCGVGHLRKSNPNNLVTWEQDMAELTGLKYGGVK